MDILNIASDIVKLIKSQNQDAEVIIYDSHTTVVSQRLLKRERISQSKNCTIGIRAIAEKNKAAYICTNNLDSMKDTVHQVITMAKHASVNSHISIASFYDQHYLSSKDLDIIDDTLITIEHLTQSASSAEDAALSEHSITNSEGASASYSQVNTVLATSAGFIGSFCKSTFTNHVSVIASTEHDMRIGYDYDISCHFKNLKLPSLIGKQAAHRAISQLNARTVKTGKFPVVFDKRITGELVRNFADAINGNSIIGGSSCLQDSLYTQIFNHDINIIDNPLLKSGIASRPFDGEGIISQKNIFVKKGILKNWILDLYTAKKLKLDTTGNAKRASNSIITPAASNFYIENGTISFEELLYDIKQGIYITDLFGFGVNLVNGDYSQGASGFFIEHGHITYPIHEIVIASNLKTMFHQLLIANDLTFCGQFNAPTIKVSEMTVAGSSK
ncbi:TldD/PmbA family protein [Wolbachia endosymbiont of Howardula sp.]|uniref:TldD/PmbA family protein n=1 Tax=Wolbachia endosymbiont of Howardula sp. TaxID=2916816 RepID=UPI00217EB384|nr:TldD/PmbA family protein [Wolbachia endosymbiont of Howardula sp.]UWI83030.1 TldD/PmbA family protein [Wolbachia endosymbiont of Howardula sp.]